MRFDPKQEDVIEGCFGVIYILIGLVITASAPAVIVYVYLPAVIGLVPFIGAVVGLVAGSGLFVLIKVAEKSHKRHLAQLNQRIYVEVIEMYAIWFKNLSTKDQRVISHHFEQISSNSRLQIEDDDEDSNDENLPPQLGESSRTG